ncbi:hypothetical protein A2926_03055 [Candidatus Giovannonibacteria bacterium RIFCSPLOWO2_01_FULL_44_40]|uniref:HTH arsR-type domain-containing protein n=1 Tax=Candidatus Giovannonibacteria bacterium RIFCSPHIGHO2_01_FULL_45_23 TaxID=1798325 RepID=A0A1F5VJQ2_9BACT|nr:MAG: hypothetical protein A2834_04575 [Candidatus Giovannonibacteria bacterium RIFCSPHIGHO2_01_FULL_45_23]OGF76442.1 MAG: hypothetical protein A3C77_01535 [Candidatus Giovannonibacteria bacterium RIFCSPHIGHO2_02_FULL_45_13]OGF80399.1 MAG: hypothetical protein A2926_03055 [Candidatus Giovannonibacteria bacterium RIFCSPLOWO2_01_FULL_44_40]
MHVLEKLFGSAARVKLLRLFLLSPEKVFTPKEAAKILKISRRAASKEAKFLKALGFLRKRPNGFTLSQTFPYLLALRNLLVNASPVSREKMLKFFKNKGKIKLLVLGGVFAGDFAQNVAENRLDLLIVGELRRGTVERFVKKIEAEVGKELNWTLLASAEFDHRLSMHDRMLRDLLDYPHEFLINKLGIE